MRTFVVMRNNDVSGISGTGKVAEGVMFSDGQVVIRWLSLTPSTNIYGSMSEFIGIHGHEGSTTIEWTL
jgi:hypothetical protein